MTAVYIGLGIFGYLIWGLLTFTLVNYFYKLHGKKIQLKDWWTDEDWAPLLFVIFIFTPIIFILYGIGTLITLIHIGLNDDTN